MKRIIVTILFFSCAIAFGQEKKIEIKKVLHAYINTFDTPVFSFNFVDNELEPALIEIEQSICETANQELLELFFDTLKKTQGCAEDMPKETLAGIYICNPELIIQTIQTKYNDPYYAFLLEYGFWSRTFGREKSIPKYKVLVEKLNLLFYSINYVPQNYMKY